MTELTTTPQETPKIDFLSRPLLAGLALDWEKSIYLLFILLAIVSRFWNLGDRVMSHDESLHTQYSYQYYNGDGYQHTPLMHGPSLFHITALSYWLFGDSDASARAPVAILGIILVALPYLLRNWLGRVGSLFASFMFLISPMVTYHSRYIRHDIYIITWAMILFIAIWHYLRQREEKYLWWFSIGLVLMFTTMETSFIYTAIFGSFLIIRLAVQILQAPWFRRVAGRELRTPLLVVAVALILILAGFAGERLIPRMLDSAEPTETTATTEGFAADPNAPAETTPAEAVNAAERSMGWLQVLGFVVLAGGLFLAARAMRSELDNYPEFDLVILFTTLVLPTVSPFLVRLVGGNPLDYSITRCADAAAGTPGQCLSLLLKSPMIVTSGFLVLTLVAGALVGLWWNSRRWLIAAAIFHTIFLLLFTSFFTNPGGWTSGMVGSLGYWLEQQGVQRGNQPTFYYFFIVPFYEFLTLIFALLATWYWLRKQRLNRVLGYWLVTILLSLLTYSLVNWFTNRQAVLLGEETSRVTAVIIALLVLGAAILFWFVNLSGQIKESYGLKRSWSGLFDPLAIFAGSSGDAFAFSVIWWILLNWIAYSVAGEKMPWLSTHFTVPMALLAGWYFHEKLTSVDPGELLSRRTAALVGLGVVFLVAAGLALRPLILGQITLGDQQADNLAKIGRLLGSLILAGLVFYLLFQTQDGVDVRVRRRAWLLAVFAVLSFLTIRFTYLSSFVNADYSTEFMVYAHGAPATKSVVLNRLEELSLRLHGDKSIKVAFDNDVSWPMTWYLRDYPNRIYFGQNPGRNITEAPIVIVGSENWSKVEPILGDDYEINTYTFLWWPMEKYRDISWNAIFGYDPAAPETRQRGLLDPQVRQALWDVFFYRDYTKYGQVFGGVYTAGQWPLRHDLRLYIRKDVLSQLWDYGVTAVNIAPPVDPYAGNELTPTADLVFAGSGDSGPLVAPRNVAIGPDGNLYVADSGNHRIAVFDVDGRFLRDWGSMGSEEGQFNEPWGLAVDENFVYVADTWNHRIQKFTLDGELVGVFGTSGTPAEGDTGGGLFFGPRDILVLPDGQLLVTDTGNHRMQILDNEGNFVRQVGSFGVQLGQLNEPVGLALGPDGMVYLADTWNGRIQKFSADLVPFLEWPVEAWEGDSTQNKPYPVVDSAGRVYVTDPEGYRILVFSSQGQYLARFGLFGQDLSSFGLPNGLAMDANDNLYVADAGNNRILRFPPLFADAVEEEPVEEVPPVDEGENGEEVIPSPSPSDEESGEDAGEDAGVEPSPSPTGEAAEPSPTASREETAAILEQLGGEPCPDSDFTCVTLTVPLDPFNADSAETLDVVFAVLPATGERKGMFVTATGGPGYSGLAAADSYTAAFDPTVTEQFDIVFFDQRGIAASGGLQCVEAAVAFYRADWQTITDEQEAAFLETAETFAEDCVAEMGIAVEQLPFYGTRYAVEDLEAFRQVMGDEQFWLYGESYGTQYAQTYAAAHPEQLAGLILDGTVDLTLSGPDYYVGQATAFHDVLVDTLNTCTADELCAADFGGDALAFYDDLAAEITAAPVLVNFPLPSGGTEERPFSLSDLEYVVTSELYSEGSRLMLLRALAAAYRGDMVPLTRLLYADLYLDPETLEPIPDPTYSDAVYYTVECNDYNYYSGTPAERGEAMMADGDALEGSLPYLSSLFYGDIPCLFWPTVGEAERPAPLTAENIPTLVLGATADTATPVENGISVFGRLADGYLFTTEGGAHVVFGRGDACPDEMVTAFLVEDELPAERETVCKGVIYDPYEALSPADAAAFADPLEAMIAADTEWYYLPEYFYWDYATETAVGCRFGGTLTFAATDDGEEYSLDNCAFAEGFALSGSGNYDYAAGLFSLTVTVSGAQTGNLVYTRNDEDGTYTLTGEFNGATVDLAR